MSYVIGCEDTRAGMMVDPALGQRDRYLALAAERGLRIHYVAETHTHADHFSAARELGKQLGARIVMHRLAAAPFADVRVDDGEAIACGKLRIRVVHTPGHTDDSCCLVLADRVLTGDTLLIGGTGRTDLPTGDPHALHASLFEKVLKLDDALAVYPAHDYKGRSSSTIGAERANNPRLQRRERAEFVEMMTNLNLAMPEHLSEALRTNRTGGKTVRQMIAEASRDISFMSMEEVRDRIADGTCDLVVRRRPRARRLRAWPHPGRAPHLARPARAARRSRAARSDRAHPGVLPDRPHLDARRRDAALDGLRARRRARRWLRGLVQGRLVRRSRSCYCAATWDVYASAESSSSSSVFSVGSSSIIQPLAYGSPLTSSGASMSVALTASTLPETGA